MKKGSFWTIFLWSVSSNLIAGLEWKKKYLRKDFSLNVSFLCCNTKQNLRKGIEFYSSCSPRVYITWNGYHYSSRYVMKNTAGLIEFSFNSQKNLKAKHCINLTNLLQMAQRNHSSHKKKTKRRNVTLVNIIVSRNVKIVQPEEMII